MAIEETYLFLEIYIRIMRPLLLIVACVSL